ncbi:MAG: nitroreductase family protein [Myxococcota bacterium]|nr:nitroreductase family protein [Myxococcota bacterium]
MPSTLDLSPDALLSTTRAVRKRLDFDRPVDPQLIRECLEIALQAPSGSNSQGWHFVVVTDEAKRQRIGELYAQGFDIYRNMQQSAHALAEAQDDSEDAQQMERVVDSAEYLAANLHRAPVMLIPCVTGRTDSIQGKPAVIAHASQYGSVLPAFWSFMLAARARGLGTAWTTIHLMYEEEIADLLGIPFAEVTQCALSPVAHTLGTDFKAARRHDLDSVMHVDTW